MGMEYPFQKEITADIELKKLDREGKKAKMRRLSKNQPHTWWNGPASKLPLSNLDHMVASDHLAFRQFVGSDIDVRDWPSLAKNKQAAWIKSFTDHGPLYLEVQRL